MIVFCAGTIVELKPQAIRVCVVSVQVKCERGDPSYEVEWWKEGVRYTAWIDGHRLSAVGETGLTTIGFSITGQEKP